MQKITPKVRTPGNRSATKRQQVKAYLLDLIESKTYGPGETLPTVRTLASEFRCSTTPVQRTLRELQEEGLIEMSQGQGCRVRNVTSTPSGLVVRPVIDIVGVASRRDIQTRHSHKIAGTQLGLIHTLGSHTGIKMIVSTVERMHDPEAMEHVIKEIIDTAPDGLAIGQVGMLESTQLARLRQLQSAGTHIVWFASHQVVPDFDCVIPDFEMGQRLLTEHFLKKGHKELLRLAFQPSETRPPSFFEQQKVKGFHEALAAAGYKKDAAEKATAWIRAGSPQDVRLQQLIGILALTFQQRPVTAVMAGNDFQAAEVRMALQVLGRKDVEVAGYDASWSESEEELAEQFGKECLKQGPPISVNTCLEECGTEMAHLVLKRVFKEETRETPVEITVPQELFIP